MSSGIHFYPINSEPPDFSKRSDPFLQDLEFIYQTLLENHPGVYNQLDPLFLTEMKENFTIAQKALASTSFEKEKAKILQKFGDHFQDNHLGVGYNLIQNESPSRSHQISLFSIQELKRGCQWITIPSFQPPDDQIEALNQIINALPMFREQSVIFDLRGNGGGNSAWGETLLEALFGKTYAEQCLTKLNWNQSVDWRASQENVEHVKNFISSMKMHFGENHPAVKWAEKIYEGINTAFLSGALYYSEKTTDAKAPPVVDAVNPVNGKVIAIIDKQCGSATLDFLDQLKVMKSDLILVGETTKADSVYMEVRVISLPSSKGKLAFPIKVYRNRPRGHNVPHTPDIHYPNLSDTVKLQNYVSLLIEN
jgi:hypothetical protein